MTKKTCRPFAKLLKAWLDGEVPPGRVIQVERHLATCADCKRTASDFDKISRMLKSPHPGELPSLDIRLLRERIHGARREEVLLILFLKRVAAVAALLLVVSLGTLLWSGSRDNRDDLGMAWRDNVMEVVLSGLPLGEDF